MKIRFALKIILSSILFPSLECINSSEIKSLEEENSFAIQSPDCFLEFSPNYSNLEDFDFKFGHELNQIQEPSEHSSICSNPATFFINNSPETPDITTNNHFDHSINIQEESNGITNIKFEDKNESILVNASDLSDDHLLPNNESVESKIFQFLENFFSPNRDRKVQEDFYNQSVETMTFFSDEGNNLNEENSNTLKDNLIDCKRSNEHNNSREFMYTAEDQARQILSSESKLQSENCNIVVDSDNFESITESLKSISESSDDNYVLKNEYLKAIGWNSNIDRIYKIREKMKSIEKNLKSMDFVEIDDLLKVFIFHLRQIYFWIENNDYGKNKIDEVYKSFPNVKIDTSLESIQIKDHRQISNIKDCFWNILFLIKKVLTKRTSILVRDLEFELKCEFSEIFRFLGVKDFKFSGENKSYQDDNITIFKTFKGNCEKILIGFNNFVPRGIISMCIYGSNAFILVSYKYVSSEIFLFKFDLETCKSEIFSNYFKDSKMKIKMKFYVDCHKIIADSIGNLYILQRFDDKFEILVLDQNMIKLRSLTEEKLVNDLNITRAAIADIKINLDILYIFDQINLIIAVHDCLFNFIKSIDIKKYIDPSVENFFTVSGQYIFLVSTSKFYISYDFGETFFLKFLKFKSRIANVTCSPSDNELIIGDVNGNIRFCRIYQYGNPIFLKISNSYNIMDQKGCKYSTFDVFNGKLYALEKKLLLILIHKTD